MVACATLPGFGGGLNADTLTDNSSITISYDFFDLSHASHCSLSLAPLYPSFIYVSIPLCPPRDPQGVCEE